MQRSEIDLGRDFFGLVLEERWLREHRVTTSRIIVAGQRRLEWHLDFILTRGDSALSMALSFDVVVGFFWRQLAVDYVDPHGLQVVHESWLLFFIVLKTVITQRVAVNKSRVPFLLQLLVLHGGYLDDAP